MLLIWWTKSAKASRKQGWNVQQEFFLDILTLENEVITFPQNTGIYLPINASSCLKRLESSPAKSANFMEQSFLRTAVTVLPLYRSLLRAGCTLRNAPRMDTAVSATMLIHVYQCIRCHSRRQCDQSHNSYVTLAPGLYHSLWTLLKLSESSPNLHIQSF